MQLVSQESIPLEVVRRVRGADIAFVPILFGISLLLGILTVTLEVATLPIVVLVFFAFPWFVRNPFKAFIFLIVTWPALTLYIRIRLPTGMPDMTYERVLALLLVAILLLPALTFKRKLPRPAVIPSIYFFMRAFSVAVALLLGGLVKPDLAVFLNSIAIPVVMYWLTKSLIKSTWHLKMLLYAFIIASVTICLSGIYERAIDALDSPFPVSPHNAEGDTRYFGVPRGRAAGVMANPAIYGAVVGMGALASLAASAHAQRRSAKLIWGLAAGLLMYGVFVSYTRSAWIAVIIALFITQFFIKNLWKKILPIFVIATLLLILASDSLLENDIVQNRILEEKHIIGRIDRVEFALEKFEEKPLFGWGPAALDALTEKRFPVSGFSGSHNTFVTILVDGGLLMFLCFVALITAWFWRAMQVIRLSAVDSFERSAIGVFAGCILIYLLSGLSLELRFFGYTNALLWISAGAIERLHTFATSDEKSSVAIEVQWQST